MSENDLRDIRDAVGALREAAGALREAKEAHGRQIATLFEMVNSIPRCTEARHLELDSRVKKLELSWSKVVGIVLACSTIASLVGWGIDKIVK